MQREQLNHWVHAKHIEQGKEPKIFVISCANLSSYLLAVEYKHKLEPIKGKNEPLHFDSLELVKAALHKMGVHTAYLRLHNVYDECGETGVAPYHDIELSIH
ncbi:conserved hypothetical protein [Vibrio nigripulchritudo MADA3029]|uniref:Uncharacterized protein n=1 Tax=Vibrio nigripulchritudo TaxID=28173 RepID=U4K1V1_9VIBR|nr:MULTISPECIES: DUF6482 family protein [Vibrio]UAB70922.1 hypothetical protein INR79_03155 [Vibrio sp. SCSIO 43132]CCN48024.1 conserved hypothetical protein [Vibrio nigripulchritudo MADA3020]CCN53104.1 conserved hypothetical protein [Vibrio nigripulchritudo MADA3021]CCN57872.1 conserved hypothetical protein [Vibrio nigripulchritudo MADA3029]CCN83344.1 conserved hypothetical protein [Vibrio nigripulchritudo BLFn1]